MSQLPDFPTFFSVLWGYAPFPWQRLLADRLAEGTWPKALDLPTAAGKTACIDIAVYALAAQADKPTWERTAPRRIWFVVDRRIVVDEAFERAQELAGKLHDAKDGPLKEVADRLRQVSSTERPLAVARLRGGVLRDDGWARLPSQPAVITSTVDQLGSRLLFRGYGRSALTAPIFAGLAAHDSLILLDEAHLSVPFMQTLRTLERYRGEDWAEQPIRTPFAFAMLSATPPPDVPDAEVFPGAEREAALDHPELLRRMGASKPAELVLVKARRASDHDPLVEAAAKRAEAFVKEQSKRRVAVIVNRVRTAESIAQALRAQHGDEIATVLLTGRLRPYERDRLVARWKPVLQANKPQEPERPVVLVSTQCIEVGADFSFDALVTEAASLDALRQRFGRLNRLGRLDDSSAVILACDEDVRTGAEDFVYGTALSECWRLLDELAERRVEGKQERKLIDFGVAALDARLQGVDGLAPFLAPVSDAPLLLPAHVDLLCQTSPRPQVEPGVELYLHGIGRGAPEVRVVWRADLNPGKQDAWAETVALCPPNSAESVGVPLYRLRRWLADEAMDDDSSDVEGARESDEQRKEYIKIKPVLLWQGRDRSRVCTGAAQIHSNDLVVLPAAYGMAGLAQSAPDRTLGPTEVDIWEPSHAQSGKAVAVRLHREVLKPWLTCPPLEPLMKVAEDSAWERDTVQEAIDGVLAYRPEGDEDAPAPPEWWIALLKQARGGRYEQHPAGGLVLYERKAAKQEDEEQDLFADDDDLLSATGQEVSLGIHSASVERAVEKLAGRCLPDSFTETLKKAAFWHDAGKLDERFQVLLWQGNELAAITGEPLAKSAAIPASPARRRAVRAACHLPEKFRHEMLSLQLAEHYLPNGNVADLDDLLFHTVGSHHGYGRPFAPVCLDPDPPPVRAMHDGVNIATSPEERIAWPAPHSLASGISERFWRLNRRYGWWGLAYLEAILRLGDWYGSRWMVAAASERTRSASDPVTGKALGSKGETLALSGIDGGNPLGFLAALGALVVLHQAGHKGARLMWRRNGLSWQPQMTDLPTDNEVALSEMLAGNLGEAKFSDENSELLKQAEHRVSRKRKEIKDKRNNIKKRGLGLKERKLALEEEVVPLEHELEDLRKAWLEALRESVPRPELALGKNIDCTEPEYRDIVEPLMESAHDDRGSLDLLAAFCSTGCLHDSPTKRKDGKLAPTPFAFISGSGRQDFLATAGDLLKCVSTQRVQSTLFAPWIYQNEGLSMRWDPVEDRRYALMDRDPTASDNKPRSVWMANLLAYRALALFPSAPGRRGLATLGWTQTDDEPHFSWPLWLHPIGPDSIRSLMLLPELHRPAPSATDRAALRAIGIGVLFRSRRIKVGSGANFKINFSPAREV